MVTTLCSLYQEANPYRNFKGICPLKNSFKNDSDNADDNNYVDEAEGYGLLIMFLHATAALLSLP